ncbi:MAG: hypothetical protein AB1414_12280 [bacterium]
MNIYLELTHRFNTGKLRAIISSGQAVVLHRLAIMSKDGDWILREDSETMKHILTVLSEYGAQYRFGAPLDIRWMSGGWSSHFEFWHNQLRIRTDFLTRPPRISKSTLKKLWQEQKKLDLPFVGLKELAAIKMTNREKDYAVIGELARLMSNPRDQFLYSRSARDLIILAEKYPSLVQKLMRQRPFLEKISQGRERLEEAIDAEKRMLIHVNEKRLEAYIKTSEKWQAIWPDVAKKVSGYPLIMAHEIMVKYAEEVLPFQVAGEQLNDSNQG